MHGRPRCQTLNRPQRMRYPHVSLSSGRSHRSSTFHHSSDRHHHSSHLTGRILQNAALLEQSYLSSDGGRRDHLPMRVVRLARRSTLHRCAHPRHCASPDRSISQVLTTHLRLRFSGSRSCGRFFCFWCLSRTDTMTPPSKRAPGIFSTKRLNRILTGPLTNHRSHVLLQGTTLLLHSSSSGCSWRSPLSCERSSDPPPGYVACPGILPATIALRCC